jgi:hypothetical protein
MAARGTLVAGIVILALAASFAVWTTRAKPTPADAPVDVEVHQEPAAKAELVEPLPLERAALAPLEAPAEAKAPEHVPAGALTVRVVDAQGRPCPGVPVALFAQDQVMPMPAAVVRSKTRAPDGLAWLEIDLRKKSWPADMRRMAGIDLPLEPGVERDLGTWIPGTPWEGGTVELVLPDGAAAWLEPLSVFVSDAQGEPVTGIDVEFLWRQRLNPSGENIFGRATTRAPDGVASISRDAWSEEHRKLAVMQIAVDLEARCTGPFVPPPSAPVPAAPSSEPVRIVLPPTAVVEARLLRSDGTRVESGARVSLAWLARGSDRREGRIEVAVADGRARFEHVGLGLDLRLWGGLEGGLAQASELALHGPARAGETLAVELALGREYPLLVGRLLDSGGDPAAGRSFDIASELIEAPPRPSTAQSRRLGQAYRETDDQGGFSIPWGSDASSAGLRLNIVERPHPKHGAPEGWIPQFAVVPFPALSADGARLDVGEVTLAPVPVVLAGRVVDVEGRGVLKASLSLGYPEGEGSELQWRNLPGPSVSTRADGSFEVRSLQRMNVLRVSARRNRIGESATVEVRLGTIDLVLVLEPQEDYARTRGSVLGSLRVDEEIPLLELELRLDNAEADFDSHPWASHIAFKDVEPGTYSLTLRTSSGFVLEKYDGVVVLAGQTTRDARLQGIDLRGRLRVLRLRLSTQAGAPLARTNVSLVAGEERAHLSTDEQGRLTALVRAEDLPLELRVQGHEPLAVSASPDEQSLVLQ